MLTSWSRRATALTALIVSTLVLSACRDASGTVSVLLYNDCGFPIATKVYAFGDSSGHLRPSPYVYPGEGPREYVLPAEGLSEISVFMDISPDTSHPYVVRVVERIPLSDLNMLEHEGEYGFVIDGDLCQLRQDDEGAVVRWEWRDRDTGADVFTIRD